MSNAVGRTAFALAGVVVGSFFPPFGAFIGGIVGGVLGALVFPPPDQTVIGPRLDDLTVSSSTYGRPWAWGWGTFRIGGNIVWSPGLVEHRVEETQSAKGGPEITTVSFLYTASLRINFTRGPADGILKIWADKKLVHDVTGTGPIDSIIADQDHPGSQAIRKFLGTETQLPGPAEQADKGIDNTPAYRGLVGIEFEDFPLKDFGNRIPNIETLITTNASDIKPLISTTPLQHRTTERMARLFGTVWVSISGSSIYTIDLATQTQLVLGTTTADTKLQIPAVDGFGNIFLSEGLGSIDPISLIKTDPHTLQETIVQIDNTVGSVWSDWATGAIAVGSLGSERIFYFQVGGGNKLAIISSDDLSTLRVVDVPSATYGEIASDSAITRAADETVWALYILGSDMNLVQFDSWGVVLQTVLISGEGQGDLVTYYEGDNSLILLSDQGNWLKKLSLDSLSITDTLSLNINSFGRNEVAFREGPSDGGIITIRQSRTGFAVVDVSDMSLRSFSILDWGLPDITQFDVLYDVTNHAAVTILQHTNLDINWMLLDRQTGGNVQVSDIVSDISLDVGLIAGEIDVTALTDNVHGYVVTSVRTARNAIEPLAQAFLFRARESDFQVEFVKRGGSSLFTIQEDDLGATADLSERVSPIDRNRQKEFDLPEVVDVIHVDKDRDYQQIVQSAKRIREAISTRRHVQFDFPGSFVSNSAARQSAEKMLFTAWNSRNTLVFNLSWEYLRVDPGDVGDVVFEGDTFQVEVLTIQYGANGVLQLETVLDESDTFVSSIAGVDSDFTEQTIELTGTSALFVIDRPLLRDKDDGTNVIYLAGGPTGTGTWPGEIISKSTDGVNYNSLTSIPSSNGVEHGTTSTTLGNSGARVWDRVGTVTIKMSNGTLSSDTEINVLNGANALMIGNEVVQFASSVDNGDGTFTISNLLRGRRGTEPDMGDHASGDRVIVLSADTLVQATMLPADFNQNVFFRGITVGGSITGATVKQDLFEREAEKPLFPVHIKGTRGASPDDWTITWVRQTRVGGEWTDFTDAALGEVSEDYEVDILDGSGDVVRTITTTASAGGSVVTAGSQQALYTETDQTSDFGAVQDTLDVRVYQLSEAVGRGFAGTPRLAIAV